MPYGNFDPTQGNAYNQFNTPEAMSGKIAQKLVLDYNRNPHAYSEEEGGNVAFLAARYGLEFKPESKSLQIFFYSLANSASLGALGGMGFEAPREVGEEYGFSSGGGGMASALGSLAGFAVPGIGGAKLAKAGLSGAAKLAPGIAAKATAQPRLASAIRGGATGGAALGLSNLLGDPSGVPENVAYGAVGGATLGATFPRIFSRPESMNKYGNEVPLLPAGGGVGPRGQISAGGPSGSPMAMGSGQPALTAGQRPALPMGRVPRQNRLPEATPVGEPINLGGSLPYMTDDTDKMVNAIRNLNGQQAFGRKSAFNRLKSQIDQERWFNGTLTDEVRDIGRTPY